MRRIGEDDTNLTGGTRRKQVRPMLNVPALEKLEKNVACAIPSESLFDPELLEEQEVCETLSRHSGKSGRRYSTRYLVEDERKWDIEKGIWIMVAVSGWAN